MGENIYKFRKERKLSQEQLAELVGVSRQTISNWELNETVPDANQLLALSKSLGVSIDKLLNNEVLEETSQGEEKQERDNYSYEREKALKIQKEEIENKIKYVGFSLGAWIVALLADIIALVIVLISGAGSIPFFVSVFFLLPVIVFNLTMMSVRMNKLQKQYKMLNKRLNN